MGVRAILRVAVIAFAAVLSLVVYLSWTPSRPAESSIPEEPALATTSDPLLEEPLEEGDREVEAVTRDVQVSQSRNGKPVFTIQAAEHVAYTDGWSNWSGVTLTVHGRRDEDDVVVVGDTMRSTGEVNDFDEVRIVGNVRARLPGDGQFETRRLIYDAVTGVVSNCNRNTLLYAGIEVRADCLYFQTAGDVSTGAEVVAEELRMWGDLTLRAGSGDGSGIPDDLRGGAEEMRFVPGGETVHLSGGEPVLELAGANVRGDAIAMDVGEGARQLRGVEATGNARARYRVGAASASRDGGDRETGEAAAAAVEEPDAAARQLRGDNFSMSLDSGRPAQMTVVSERGVSRLTLPDLGRLEGRQIVVTDSEDGQAIEARGRVAWQSRDATQGLEQLAASTLALSVAGSRLERLDAAGGVEATLATGNEPLRFAGPSLAARWGGAGLDSIEWAEGVAFEAEGRSISAAEASYEGSEDTWILEGLPRPALRGQGVDLTADELQWRPGAGVRAQGDVRAQIADAYLAAAAALFGEASEVSISAASAELRTSGALKLSSDVEVIWERQSLLAGELLLEPQPGRLSASREVELVTVLQEPGEANDGFVTLTAGNLLVEEGEPEIRAAGSARLRQEGRRIQAERLTVALAEDGSWSNVLAEEQVQFRDRQVEASGESMLYELVDGALTLEGSTTVPAVFRLGDLEYRSTEAPLRISYEGDNVIIRSTENGRTRTAVVERGGSGP